MLHGWGGGGAIGYVHGAGHGGGWWCVGVYGVHNEILNNFYGDVNYFLGIHHPRNLGLDGFGNTKVGNQLLT